MFDKTIVMPIGNFYNFSVRNATPKLLNQFSLKGWSYFVKILKDQLFLFFCHVIGGKVIVTTVERVDTEYGSLYFRIFWLVTIHRVIQRGTNRVRHFVNYFA